MQRLIDPLGVRPTFHFLVNVANAPTRAIGHLAIAPDRASALRAVAEDVERAGFDPIAIQSMSPGQWDSANLPRLQEVKPGAPVITKAPIWPI